MQCLSLIRFDDMVSAGVLFHFYAVECRALYLIYGSVIFQVLEGTRSIFASTRHGHWCTQPECVKTLTATNQCITQGVLEAMLSTDTSYENPHLCIEFHHTNILFPFFVVPTVLLLTVLLVSGIELFRQDVQKFTDSKYLTFTTNYVHEHVIVRVVVVIGLCYLGCLISSVPLECLYLLPQSIVDSAGQTRYGLLVDTMMDCIPSYIAILASSYNILTQRKHIAIFTSLNQNIEIKRTSFQLLIQTNFECLRLLEQAVLRANFGEKEPLQKLLADPTELDAFVEKFSQSKDEMGYIQVAGDTR